MDSYIRYRERILNRIDKKLDYGSPVLIYMPPSIYPEYFFNNRFRHIRLDRYLFKYSSANVYRIFKLLQDKVRDKTIVSGIDLLLKYYPRRREVILDYLGRVRDRPIGFTITNYKLYNSLKKAFDYESISFREANLSLVWDDLIKDDNISYSEGSITAYNIIKSSLDYRWNIIKSRYLFKDSNLRLLLYYFTFYRGVGGLAKIVGSQVGTYINRLMNMDLLIRVGRKRAVYMIRDPLIRIVFTELYGRGPIWRYSGYHYLIRKLLEGVKGIYKIETYTGELYIGEPVKFDILMNGLFRFVDKDGVRYIVGLGTNQKQLLKIFDKYRKYTRIIVFGYEPDTKEIRKFKSRGIHILTPNYLELITRDIGFRRPI